MFLRGGNEVRRKLWSRRWLIKKNSRERMIVRGCSAGEMPCQPPGWQGGAFPNLMNRQNVNVFVR